MKGSGVVCLSIKLGEKCVRDREVERTFLDDVFGINNQYISRVPIRQNKNKLQRAETL